jgi:hypothetical protein
MELTIDTSWFTRYRSRSKNPDLGDSFPNAITVIGTGRHTAIPRNDSEAQLDTGSPNGVTDLTQFIANTAGFHFAFIEQGGTSLYAQLAQRVTSTEVLRILLSIGGTEIAHFQTWHDKAGNAPPLTGVHDPVSGDTVVFPDLTTFAGNEDLQTNLIMAEPTVFLSKHFPVFSIIRPTETTNAAKRGAQIPHRRWILPGTGVFLLQLPERPCGRRRRSTARLELTHVGPSRSANQKGRVESLCPFLRRAGAVSEEIQVAVLDWLPAYGTGCSVGCHHAATAQLLCAIRSSQNIRSAVRIRLSQFLP